MSHTAFYELQQVVDAATDDLFTERLKLSVRDTVALLRAGKFVRLGEDSRHCHVRLLFLLNIIRY